MEITYLQELVQLFLIFHYSNVGLTVTSNVLTYFSTVGTVQTSWNTSISPERKCEGSVEYKSKHESKLTGALVRG